MKEEIDRPTLEDINQEFDLYQNDLVAREKHLKLIVRFDSSMDRLLSILSSSYEVADETPIETPTKTPVAHPNEPL